MDRKYFFERNLLALSPRNPALCSRLSVAETTRGRYKFLDSLSGELIPALVDRGGAAHALHSTVDPVREARRLVAALQDKDGHGVAGAADENFVVFLGLGGGFAPEAALNNGGVSHVMVIEYDIDGIAELFCSREYVTLLGNPRFTLLVDPPPDLIESTMLELYRPALCGGIQVLPLRARAELDKQNFNAAGEAIQRAIEKVSSDYSVQAHFGKRWFANIIRNLEAAQLQNRSIPPIREAAICAAGPSLDDQIPQLIELAEQKEKRETFIICADTALGALLRHGLKPDAVVSIDCQHISYYHFMGIDCKNIPLFLDIASPPMLAEFSDAPFFFSGGHPLAAYVSQEWRPLPLLDTSGGNVTYACLSLAENLGAQRITVYGADFSYPAGRVYAKGTYIYPYFERRQERRSPLEALLSSFLYRSPFLPAENISPDNSEGVPLYETATMRSYRKRFEHKASLMDARVTALRSVQSRSAAWMNDAARRADNNKGGIPFSRYQKNSSPSLDMHGRIFNLFAPGKALMDYRRFLKRYCDDIAALPFFGNNDEAGSWLWNLDIGQRRIFTTLLPQAAALKHRQPELSTGELIEEVKRFSTDEIERVVR